MAKNHIKRVAAPKTWNILRKTTKFVTKQNPGAHTKALSLPLNNLLKDTLHLTKTTKETKYVLTKQEVLVNGVRKKDNKAQAGFLDSVTIPSMNKNYRITVDRKGMLTAKEISEEKAGELTLRVSGKTALGGKRLQLNTMNGYNLLLSEAEAKKYKTGDTVVLALKEGKIKAHHPLEKGAHAMIFTGKHSGKYGEVLSVEGGTIKIKGEGETFETNKAYAIVIGREQKAELD